MLDLAGFSNPVKSPLREAGKRRDLARMREDILRDGPNSDTPPLSTDHYVGTRYEIWEIVLSGFDCKSPH